jgi:hypothetical protein
MPSIGFLSILLMVILLQFCMPAPPIDIKVKEITNQLEALKKSVRDVGYFLRNHKFNEYDRRNKNEKQVNKILNNNM